MQKYLIVLLSIALLTPWVGFAPPMEAAHAPPAGDNLTSQELKQRAMDAYLNLPLYFVANQGQVDESVGYYAQGGGHSIYFTAEEVVMALDETVLRMRFVRAEATPPVGVGKRAAKVNYFIGNDPEKWRTDIPTYGQVVYHELYPDIDLRYGGQNGALKYTFVVQPGADVSQIRLACGGAAGLRLDEAGNLLILAGGQELKDTRPYAYQEIGGRRVEIEAEFVLHGVRTYGFAVRGSYDPRYLLIIDPTLLYSTYLGGNGDDHGNDIAVDGAGNAYVTGHTNSTNFPTQSAYQGNQPGEDVFVTKIDLTQSGAASLVYSTHLGGDGDDSGIGIAVDGAGNAYVIGGTQSTNFPTENAYQGTHGGGTFDALVTKLNASGNGLLYSTYLGGSSDDIGKGIAVDGNGHAYVTGETHSNNFPTQNYYDNSLGGSEDAFVTRIDTMQSGATSLIYSTYLGGSNGDSGMEIAADGAGHAYVTGQTISPNFPTQNAYQGHGGGYDAFVTKLYITDVGSLLLYSTYLGGSVDDAGRGIALDGDGNAYVTGHAFSTNFPTTENAYQGTCGGCASGDVFVARIDAMQSGEASLVYSTFLGGSLGDNGRDIAVDEDGNAYVTGLTDSSNFPTHNPYDDSLGGGRDAFIAKFNATGSDLLYSTYLGGGSGDEIGYGIAVDGAGHVYVTGETSSSTDFPTTTNAYQGTHGGGTLDAFVVKLVLPVQSKTTFTNQAGEVVSGYYVGGGIYVTVNDPDENENPSAQESVNVTVSDAATGDSETLALTEMGNNTGIFHNTTALPSSENATGAPGNGTLETQAGDTIKVSYTDPDDSADKSSDTATMLALGSSLTTFTGADGGEVNGYVIGVDPIYVTVIDADENTNPAGRQAVSAVISDTNTGDSETLALLETGDDTGQFRNTMGLSSTDSATGTPGNGALETKVGHIIGASYTDDDDSSDKSSDTAAITSLFNAHLPVIMKSYAPFCNGDFEQGTSCWSFGGMERHTVSTAMPHGGSQAALLGGDKSVYGCDGGVPQGSAWMEQTFNVPDEGSPKLSFWYRLYSYDKTKERARVDSFEVKIDGTIVFEDLLTWATAYGCDGPPNDGGWQQVTLDLSAYKGQTITLHFEVWDRADNWYNTWAYIDDVSIQ